MFSISDKVAIMNNGVIEQYDSPETIYRLPRTKFVAEFIGFENFSLSKNGSWSLSDTNKSNSEND